MIEHLSSIWPVFATALHIFLGIVVTVHAVLHKHDTRAVIGWVGLAWLAPYVGPAAYACFGINRIRRKAVALKVSEGWATRHVVSPSPREVVRQEEVVERHPTLSGLAALGGRLTGRPLLPGNRVIQSTHQKRELKSCNAKRHERNDT